MSEEKCRLGTVGGQAVIEGVMMKNKERCALAIRMPDGSIMLKEDNCKSIRDKHKLLNLPIIRGIVNFIESLILSYKTLSLSTAALGLEEEETKFEKWLKEKFGKSIMDIIMVISTILGLALGIGLFFYLPLRISSFVSGETTKWYSSMIESFIKIGIFVLYIWLVSFMKDIRRTFEYHGAEHKSIFCYEAGEELTPENVKKYSRFHPRCGTSFIFVMLLLSIFVYAAVYSIPIMRSNMLLKFAVKIIVLPLIVGLGYEFIRYAGKHNNAFTRILSMPGLWMQRLTTKEPDLEEIEVAIHALKCALPTEFPGFKEEFDRQNGIKEENTDKETVTAEESISAEESVSTEHTNG